MPTLTDYYQIIADLDLLARTGVSYFGSPEHQFQLHPPLSEADVCAFEAAYRIRLPEEYRMFLLHVGSGGAGPGYGLFTFHQMDDDDDMTRWEEGDGFVGVLARPFPYTDAWNNLTDQPDDEAMENEEEYEAQLDAFEARYYASLDGAIPLCHLGCALRQWLVVSGPEAGHIWADDRADYAGLSPLTTDGADRVSFYDWYRGWLDAALAQVRA